MSDPARYDHVIVGGGVAAAGAVQGIRAVSTDATIAVLGAEPDEPVYRPDLSKKLWLEDDAALDGSTLLEADPALEVRTGTEVTAIDAGAHEVTLADGSRVGYRRLLLATGAEPRTLGLAPGPRVVYYRTAADYRALAEVATAGSHVIVVGGGYIGSEMASALAQQDVRLTMVLDEQLVMAATFPEQLARRVTETFTERGVQVVHGTVADGQVSGSGITVRLEDGSEHSADAMVVGIGVTPRTGLGEAAGLEVDDGIVVDDHLRTSAADVFAAGDVARYPDPLLGRRRVEHVDHAEKSGEAAGRAMAGEDSAYETTPIFWSDLFDDGYEAIGEVSAGLETVVDAAADDLSAAVVYYLDGGRVRGVLLWNVWDSTPAARDLIAETAEQPVTDPASLRGRIPIG
ncbi:FAD-dependent oxidoreductase [Janibacter alkaliphilus]|uniref:NADPH-dependent 2,4-dienoyl-CoA reductase/sulfur reductase-like enzyme n=1 Tax=Janibacter alkaliphilus TaxID=1069963 RepID=A0A852X1X7_9MICO|nr:FAD-dependent oxidoreductase [Janibacter alkaliphilus]NYG36467.1 NADPH-dependent 2,4-dienoyl-CoA reductase/sulfur reductase-like enzyme [Janibacter alkaliphilus]